MSINEDTWLSSRFSVALIILLTIPFLRFIYNIYFHPLSKVPGPYTWRGSRLPFVFSLLKGTIVQDVQHLHQKYGPVVRLSPNHVTFAQMEAYTDILQLRQGQQKFLKDPMWWKKQPGHPESLTSAIDPGVHARMRKALSPAFTHRALKQQEIFIHRYVNRLVKRLAELVDKDTTGEGGEIDIAPWLHFTTFDILGDLAFGEPFGCLENSKYHPWISLLFDSIKVATAVAAARLYPLVDFILLRCLPASSKKTHRDHYQQIADKVGRRLNFELQRPDFMFHVISGDESTLTIEEINATFMVLATAGSETTAGVLSGTLNYLAQHRDKFDLLAREIRGAFPNEESITLEALRSLPYLNAILQEGLRLCPPIPWLLPRSIPPGGDTVCGIWLPEGTSVSIQVYTMNREPSYFYEPTSYLPERWLPEASTDPKSPFFNDKRQAVQSFSVGPRACIGQNLAWAEMRLLTAKIVWRFDIEDVEGERVAWEELRTFFLVEKKPIWLRMKGRSKM